MAVGDNNRLRAAWILTKVNLTRSERWVQLPPKSSFHAFEEWQPGRAVKVVRESIARETCPAMCMMVWATALRRSLPRSALCGDGGNLLPWPLVVAPRGSCALGAFSCGDGSSDPRQHTEGDARRGSQLPATEATGFCNPFPKKKNTGRACGDPLPALPLSVCWLLLRPWVQTTVCVRRLPNTQGETPTRPGNVRNGFRGPLPFVLFCWGSFAEARSWRCCVSVC